MRGSIQGGVRAPGPQHHHTWAARGHEEPKGQVGKHLAKQAHLLSPPRASDSGTSAVGVCLEERRILGPQAWEPRAASCQELGHQALNGPGRSSSASRAEGVCVRSSWSPDQARSLEALLDFRSSPLGSSVSPTTPPPRPTAWCGVSAVETASSWEEGREDKTFFLGPKQL